MKKILVILSLILCGAFEMNAQCACPETMYVDGQIVPVYGTGQWQQGTPFEMVISTNPLLKVRASYCYRVTNEGQRQVCLNILDYVFDGTENLTEEQMRNYLMLVNDQQRMLLDYLIYQLLFDKEIFKNSNNPFDIRKVPMCPSMVNGVVEVFMSHCVTKWSIYSGHGVWTKPSCGQRTFCQYQYSYCWAVENGVTAMKQTRKVIYSDPAGCSDTYTDSTGKTHKCVSADCYKDLTEPAPIPDHQDFDDKITDPVFYGNQY